MKKLLVPVVLLASVAAYAQEVSPAKITLAERTLGAMRMEAQMAKTMDMMADGMKGMTKGMFSKMPKGKTPGPEAMEMAERSQREMLELVKAEMSWEKLKPSFVKIYAETYSEVEMKAMIAFYESPEGRSVLDKTPLVTAKSMQVTQGIMANLMPKIMAGAESASKELADSKARLEAEKDEVAKLRAERSKTVSELEKLKK